MSDWGKFAWGEKAQEWTNPSASEANSYGMIMCSRCGCFYVNDPKYSCPCCEKGE